MGILKILGAVIGVVMILLLLWMNFTSGHFQQINSWCEDEVKYVEDKNNPPLNYNGARPMCVSITYSMFTPSGFMNRLLLLVAVADFNK